jgi:hypothetical protein
MFHHQMKGESPNQSTTTGMEKRGSETSSTITSVSSNNNRMMNTPTATRNTDDMGHYQSVIVQESHFLPPEIDVPHILSTITGNKNQPNVARIIGSKPPVVFVAVGDSKSNNNITIKLFLI